MCYNHSMNETYFDKRDAKNIEKTRLLCAELPDFVTEFIVGIQTRTTPLTRLGYVGDIKIFFEYLIKNKFTDKKNVKEITSKVKVISGITVIFATIAESSSSPKRSERLRTFTGSGRSNSNGC